MLPAKKSFFHPDFCLTYNISYLNVSNIRQRTVLHERCILLTFATAIQRTQFINALITLNHEKGRKSSLRREFRSRDGRKNRRVEPVRAAAGTGRGDPGKSIRRRRSAGHRGRDVVPAVRTGRQRRVPPHPQDPRRTLHHPRRRRGVPGRRAGLPRRRGERHTGFACRQAFAAQHGRQPDDDDLHPVQSRLLRRGRRRRRRSPPRTPK